MTITVPFGELQAGRTVRNSGLIEHRTIQQLSSTVIRGSLMVSAPPGSGAEETISVAPTVLVDLPPGQWTAQWFASQWGDEFSPRTHAIDQSGLRLEVTTGRSSKGVHPWLCLTEPEHGALVISPAWSGNWTIEVTPTLDGGLTVHAGISAWKFSRRVTEARPFPAPDVYLAWGQDQADAGAHLAAAAARSVIPRSAWSQSLPLAWNHWWPYEDAEINASTFHLNTTIAARLGCDVATCDAGWFGRPDAGTFWEKERGDWDSDNTARFPGGLDRLGEEVRQRGTEFGVWIEAEAIGVDARLNETHPQIIARRDDDPPSPPHEMPDPENPAWLGYICLGSPAGRDHLRGVLDRLIARSGCRWIKWDFNLDPGAGCSRTDHGHDAGDGLYEHYVGLYSILDEYRTRYPQILWEACSSGGLRIDLGLAARFHAVFLSDPDWTEFHLQLLWGAAHMLPAASIFHFSESQWRTWHGSQNLNPATLDLPTFDQALHAVALHRFAVSYKLPEFSAALQERLAQHLDHYRRWIAPLVTDEAVVHPLTAQPLRDGAGVRFPAFQLTGRTRHDTVIAAFALEGCEPAATIHPTALDPDTSYQITLIGPGAEPADVDHAGLVCRGSQLLAEGITIRPSSPARSWLIHLTACAASPLSVEETS